MNGGIGRITVGILFLVLGGLRLASDSVQALGFILILYGLFSIGHGIYKLTKERETGKIVNRQNQEEDETLDSEI
ncbi:MAG: hypothetical protein MK078_05040 [Crocinitomicaceae bacterium]|nr:hypothetical protein [Crocinitomicaceae bacterium]